MASESSYPACVTTIADAPLQVGRKVGPTSWQTMTQERVSQFAEVTGDHNFIHVDPERARETPFRGTIAHGYLTLSLIPWLTGGMLRVDGVTRGINYGSNKIRFTNMVQVGSRVRARQKLVAAEPRAGGMQLTNEVTIEIDGQQRPACVAETISLIYK